MNEASRRATLFSENVPDPHTVIGKAQMSFESELPPFLVTWWTALKKPISLYGMAIAFIVATVAPLLTILFAHNDDWNLFSDDYKDQDILDELRFGRPLYNLFMRLFVFPIVHNIYDLVRVRIIIIAILGLSFTVFTLFLRRYRLSPVVAFCGGALIFSLPGAQQAVILVVMLPIVIANFIALGSGIVLVNYSLAAKPWKNHTSGERRLFYGVVIAIVVAFFTYQNSPMFFLLPVLCEALFAPSLSVKTRIIQAAWRAFLLFFILGCCFAFYKLVATPLIALVMPSITQPVLPHYRLGFSADIPARFWKALTEWFPLETNLWFLSPSEKIVAPVVWGAIALGTVGLAAASYLSSPRGAKANDVAMPLFAVACAFALAAAANSPSLVSNGGGAFARLMWPASGLIVILLLWIAVEVFSTLPRVLNLILVGLTAAAGISAYITGFDSAMNSSMEFSIMREGVGREAQIKGPIKEMFVIMPREGRSYLGSPPFSDEFNLLSSGSVAAVQYMHQEALAAKNARAIAPLLASGETLSFDRAYFEESDCKPGFLYVSQEAVAVDFAAPMYLTRNRSTCVGGIARYLVTPVSDGAHSPSRAFANNGGDEDEFWETTPYPVDLVVLYPGAETVTAYSMGTDAEAGSAASADDSNVRRMPSAWRFEGSDDNVNWVLLDEQSGVTQWSTGASKFPIAKPGAYRAYRFVFTAGNGPSGVMRIYRLSLDIQKS